MRKSPKTVAQGKRNGLSRQPSGELTCSEAQVEDVLSAGESTEEERIDPPNQRKPPR
ncbi:MAG TPA: hypothetical protein VFQ02_08555 [Nitrospira sp.]|nr:hypothetical protein [Nitrospira sp.]